MLKRLLQILPRSMRIRYLGYILQKLSPFIAPIVVRDDNNGARRSFRSAFPAADEGEIRRLLDRYKLFGFRLWLIQEHLASLSTASLRSYVRDQCAVRGSEHLHEAIKSKRPLIFFTPHYGNFILAGIKLALELENQRRLLFFYNPPGRNAIASEMDTLIRTLDTGAIPEHNNRAGLKRVMSDLKDDGALFLMPDIFEVNPGVRYVSFFGRFALMMTGTVHFALRSGAIVLPMCVDMSDNGRFALDVLPPMNLTQSGDRNRDLYENVSRLANITEEIIRRDVSHWTMWPSFVARTIATPSIPTERESWRSLPQSIRGNLSGLIPDLARVLDFPEREWNDA